MEVSLKVSEKKPPSGCGFSFSLETISEAVALAMFDDDLL